MLGTFFILEKGGEDNNLYRLCSKNNVVRKITPIFGMVDEDRVYQISITCKEDAERDIRLSLLKNRIWRFIRLILRIGQIGTN